MTMSKYIIKYGVGERWNYGTEFVAEKDFDCIDSAIDYIQARKDDPANHTSLVLEVMAWSEKVQNHKPKPRPEGLPE